MGDQGKAGKPAEKWADRIRFISGSPETALEADEADIGALPDVYRCSDERPKTAEEVAAIADVTVALNDFRRMMCDLAPLAFPPERVHILGHDEFQTKIGHGRFSGKSILGHVYLERGGPTHLLMALLAHEMTHAVSYLWLDVRDKDAVTVDGLRLSRVLMRRTGLALIDPSYGTLLPHFHGLNEGATEMAACIIRRLAAANAVNLNKTGKRSLIGFVSSPPLMAFIERLIAVACGVAGDRVAMSRKLFTDLFAGTDKFLHSLEANLPGAIEVLRATGQTPMELLAAAAKLGFDKEAEFIRTFCE